MPQAPVDNKGTELFYTDSGPVPGSTDYTTLFIYHGSAFTGHTFHKLLPFAAKDNVRLVIVNRRDYAGSTKYTDDNLKDLNEGKASFMERLGAEVGHLLVWFAQTHKIPKISADRKSGGLSLMGWSMGNATSMSLFGYPEFVGKDTYTKLGPYFRQLILYDPPFHALGYDRPPEGYDPLKDPDYHTQEALFENFVYWVSSYFDHPDLASRSVHGQSFAKRGEAPNPDDPNSTGRRCTFENMTPEEMKLNFDGAASNRTEYPMFIPMQPTLKIMRQNVLFNEKMASEVLPKTKVVYIWCARASWDSTYGMMEAERQYNGHVKQGQNVRPIRFIEIKGGNHFAHWDDPEDFWAATVDAIKN